MNKLFILTDEASEFLISRDTRKNFTTMDVGKIRSQFVDRGYEVVISKFSGLNLNQDFKDVNIIYQTSEAPGSFYKRYIEDLIYHLMKRGARTIPDYEHFKAHHNKVFMEFLRAGFKDNALKTVKTACYGSWVDALNYNGTFPVVIKQCSSAGSFGVSMAKDRKEYETCIRKAGRVIVSRSIYNYYLNSLKRPVKKIIKSFSPEKTHFVQYNTAPVSNSLIVQQFIEGLEGDYRVLIFGRKYYFMFRKNRENDFRASGSGIVSDVPESMHESLLTFSSKLTHEIDSPVFGIDIGYDGKHFHLIEYQMLHFGTSALHRSNFWHEYIDGQWIRFEGKSDLEEEYARSIDEYIEFKKAGAFITDPVKIKSK